MLRRGAVSSRCVASTSSRSAARASRPESISTRWSQMRSRSPTRWLERMTVRSALGDGLGEHAQKVLAGQGIQRCHGFVEQQQPRPLAQRHGEGHLRPLASGERADLLVERDAERSDAVAGEVASSQRGFRCAPRAKVIFGRPAPVQRHLLGEKTHVSKEIPWCRRAACRRRRPFRSTARASPVIRRSSVVLPAPLEPIRPQMRPSGELERTVLQRPLRAKPLAETTRC